ncbi:MAG: hypothetical protein EOP56_08390 [Sphingobacteriales bacterium]|nr:MAG: hypothetical protein EOP56_08390 [Sphingobacteriales bacterium]
MKRLLGVLSLFIAFCGDEASAQDRVIDRNPDRQTPGLTRIGESRSYYTYYYQNEKGGPKDKTRVIAEILSDSLITTHRVAFTLDKSAEIVHLSPTQDRQLFLITVDRAKSTRTGAFINALGEVAQSKAEEGLTNGELAPEAYPFVFTPSADDIMLVFPEVSKQGGYRIRSINKEFVEKWALAYIPEKGNWKIDRIAQVGPTLLIVQKETAEDGLITYKVRGIEPGSGNIMFDMPLTDANKALWYPTFIRSDMGRISIGGSVFNGGRTDVKQPDGLFFMTMSLMGDVQTRASIAWSDVKAKGDKEISALFDGRSVILPRAAYFAPPQAHVVVAEVLLPSAGNAQPYSTQSTDLIAFFTDREGNYQHAVRIKKGSQDIASTYPVVAASDAIRLLDSTASLSYQGSIISSAGNAIVAYTDKIKDTTRLIFQPLDADDANKTSSIALSFPAAVKGGNKAEKITPANIIIDPQGKVVFYGYNGPRMQVASRSITMKQAARRAGERPTPPAKDTDAPQPLPESHKNANK